MKYYIGIDIGTSATKSVLFDNKGNVQLSYSNEYELLIKQNGYAEQRPSDWKNAVLSTLKEIGRSIYAKDVVGIGLSGQMHGLVLLDKDDNVLRDSIIWCDNRTADEALEIEESIGKDNLKKITGNYAMPAFTLAKLLWVKNNEKDIFDKIDKVMLPKDYIRYVLTNEFKTEFSDASGMQMLDIKNKCFSIEILSKFNINVKMLPKLIESVEISGFLTKEVENITGLKNVFVVGGAGDQAAGAIGNNIVSSGDISITLGSSGVIFGAMNKYDENTNAQMFMHAIKDTYHTMCVTNGCGLSLKWYKDEMCNEEIKQASKENIDIYDLLCSNASSIKPGSDDLFYLPYLMGERTPHLDTDATGLFFGIKKNTTKNHFIRSLLEGISYSMLDCFNTLEIQKNHIYISGGGAKSALWREIIASMINKDIKRINQDEGPALGVAILAMVANKEYASINEACKNIISINDVTLPNKDWGNIYKDRFNIYQDLYQSNKLIYKKIAQLKGKKYETDI